MLFAELPRVRLDRIRRPNKFLFDAHPTLSEVPEECEGYMDAMNDESSLNADSLEFQQRLDLNTTLTSPLGESIHYNPFNINNFSPLKHKMKQYSRKKWKKWQKMEWKESRWSKKAINWEREREKSTSVRWNAIENYAMRKTNHQYVE